jgi:sugar/nucleoside kinase (ribokinase family)
MRGDYGFLAGFGAKPGTMQLVPHESFSAIVAAAGEHSVHPGGSGANTVRALAMLIGPDSGTMGRPAYSGAVGKDETGREYGRILGRLGVDVSLAEKDLPTGVSGIVVTPDHERTMFTYLGACQDFAPADIAWDFLRDARFFYSTGYMWDTPPQLAALRAVVERANEWSVPVCLDLADPFVVDRYHRDLGEWIKGRVAILFGNRDELSRMTDCVADDDEVLRRSADLAPIVVMKVGKRGCLVYSDEMAFPVPGESVEPVDTTGAGDSFAAGFLYGLLAGWTLEECGRLANRVAARIVGVEGCRFDLLDRSEILSAFGQLRPKG